MVSAIAGHFQSILIWCNARKLVAMAFCLEIIHGRKKVCHAIKFIFHPNKTIQGKQDMQIPVVRNILEANEKMASTVRQKLAANKTLALNLISSPGAGKTSLLEHTLKYLAKEFSMAVIEGDLQTDNDARRVAATGAQAVQINTEGGCHLDSNLVLSALENINLDGLDILFIENVGNLVCPVEFDCGEDAKVAILSVAEGDDKPEKYPLLFHLAKALVLNKIDLLPHVDFDVAKARGFAVKLNSGLEIFEVSCRTGAGLDNWYNWLRKMRQSKL